MSTDTEQSAAPDLVTMPLLDRLVAQSLDQDYAHVAAQRRTAASGPAQRPPRRFGRGTAAAVAAFGLLVAVAAVQTRRDAPVAATDRAALVGQVHAENTVAAAQQRTLRQLKTQVSAGQVGLRALTREAAGAQTDTHRLAERTGYAATSGPGVRAVVDDAPDSSSADGRVRDQDLAMLVDGLWAAGARAVSINGIRLTALSPIRSSGVAIHVAFRPVSPPYTVLALGDTSTLQARLADTTHGLAWLSLVHTFGFRFTMHNESELALPAATAPVLRSARPVEDRPTKEDTSP